MQTTRIANPVIWADVPDVDVIRVGTAYYMVSTSMHSMPGCPIMKSENLRDWEIVNYVYETFEDNDAHNLRDGKGIYGKGSWAASLRFHEDVFYVAFSCNDTNRFYIYRTRDIENGPWERSVIPGLHHDPALLFDDGRVYVIYGNGSIRITELTADAAAVKPDGIRQLLFETETEGIGLRCEGCHAHKLNGFYYLFFIEWPRIGNRRRRVICYRSQALLGPYERKAVLDDDMGYGNNGVAQGGIVDSPSGDWYAVLFQDHGAVGRVPCVLPVAWKDGWPEIGIDGKAPKAFDANLPSSTSKPLVISDEFDYTENKLALQWQWNHNPDHRFWSVTDRPGYLRQVAGQLADTVLLARNTLTQRTEGPACCGTAVLETGRMNPGDRAGLVALQDQFGTVGVQIDDDGAQYVAMCVNRGDGREETVERARFEGGRIYLKAAFQFEDGADLADFFYSMDGEAWLRIGRTLQLKYTLVHFMGCRIGLFYYATKTCGGYADWEYFRYERKLPAGVL